MLPISVHAHGIPSLCDVKHAVTRHGALPHVRCRFNGGAAPEESAYMFRAHEALFDMAVRANDTAAQTRHAAKLRLIQHAMRDLWIPDRGHPAAYREESAWVSCLSRPCALLWVALPWRCALLPRGLNARAMRWRGEQTCVCTPTTTALSMTNGRMM